jgi:predicted Kef-type K+ transport protein
MKVEPPLLPHTQIIVMVLMGFLVGTWMGWKQMDSILGVILSVSSTIILKPLTSWV